MELKSARLKGVMGCALLLASLAANAGNPFCSSKVLNSNGFYKDTLQQDPICLDPVEIDLEPGATREISTLFVPNPDVVDFWFTLSIDGANLVPGYQISIFELQPQQKTLRTYADPETLGSLVVRDISGLTPAIQAVREPVFELFWQWSDDFSEEPLRIPSEDVVLHGDVPLLTDLQTVCAHLTWNRGVGTTRTGFAQIELFDIADIKGIYSEGTTIQPGTTEPAAIARAGLVDEPNRQDDSSGTITFTPSARANCGLFSFGQ